MLFASDAKIIADKIADMRPRILEDVDKISEQVFEAAKRGDYKIEYDVFYDESILVELLGEELEHYGYGYTYSQKYTEAKGMHYTVVIKWR